MLVALARIAAAAPTCSAPATVSIWVENLTAAPVTIDVDGELARDAVTCTGEDATTYRTSLVCSGTGIVRCGDLPGLRPGLWVHRLHVVVPGSDPQEQAQRRVVVADAGNFVGWTVYPRTFVVTNTLSDTSPGSLRERLQTAGDGPALVTFARNAAPCGSTPDVIVLGDVGGKCKCGATGALCIPTSRIVVDGLDCQGLPGGVVWSVGRQYLSLLCLSGSDDVFRGLVFDGGQDPLDTTQQFDTVFITGRQAQRNRIEQSIVRGPAAGDAVSMNNGAGLGGSAAGANVVVDSEITGGRDRGVKVNAAAATVARSCVHDNGDGGVLVNFGGDLTVAESVLQRNPGSKNGLAVGGDATTADHLRTLGNVIRFHGTRPGTPTRGLQIANNADATLESDVIADNFIRGSVVETQSSAPLDDLRHDLVPTATFHGVAIVCNGDTANAAARGSITSAAIGREAPHASYGDAARPGLNAFVANAPSAFSVEHISGTIPAQGNQWEHCPRGAGSGCDLSPDVSPVASVDTTGALDSRDAADLRLERVSPSRPRAGEIVRVYGGTFDAIAGNPARAACGSPLASCASDVPCPTGPCVAGTCPCAIENPAVQSANRGSGANRLRITTRDGTAYDVYPDAVTPTMLAFRMPVDCFEPLTLDVTKASDPARSRTATIPLCARLECGDQPSGSPCDDGDPCTVDDRCGETGACAGGAPAPADTACADDGNVCTADVCDAGTCTHPPGHAGAVCRPAAGLCDRAETCSGATATCPTDGFAPSTTICRASVGPCDVTDTCTGTGPDCPADAIAPPSTVCRSAAGECDAAETCDGTGITCPIDAKRLIGASCPSDGNPCSLDQCDGIRVTCQHPPGHAGAVCRPRADACDVAETCTGTSTTCPADAIAAAGTVCRPPAGDCDVTETCTGTSPRCPDDALAPAMTVCRASAGPCDVAETCTGASATCPGDVFASTATVCRPAAGSCDVSETCTGDGARCPEDAFASPTTVCRVSAGDCDVADTCTGRSPTCPADTKRPGGSVCRPNADSCDVEEHCDGAGDTCPADDRLVGIEGVACTFARTLDLPACAAAAVPRAIARSFRKAGVAVERSVHAGAAARARLLQRAGARLRKMAKAIDGAARRDAISADCAAALRDLTLDTLDRVEGQVAVPAT